MALSKEWLNRITHWDSALWQICYEPIAPLDLQGFVTRKQLTADQALRAKFHPMPVGTRWGDKWQYGWFTTQIKLPEYATGRRIVLKMTPATKPQEDGECLVWANGKIIGSFGWARKEITLTRNGIPGEEFKILVEAYAGHGPMVMGGGPNLYGQESVPEVRGPQVVVGESSFGIWREQAYQLALDFTTLYELRNRLEPTSLRVSEIDQGLKDVTMLMDLELPEPEMLETIHNARERLRPLLANTNGPTAPTFFAFGHAHIDVAWLWPWAETDRKIARTAINQLSLMDEYPDYRYLQSTPQLYIMLKDKYPELYERFKKAVMEGKVIPEAAMWVEADTNLTSGESLIRQIIYARQFLHDEFNLDSDILWQPDVFGYSGSLPQILAKSGIVAFATQKIAWTYHGGDPFPYNTFLWEGIDGTEIPAHIFTDYNSETRPDAIITRWETRLQKDGIRSMLLAFGWGDGGGGPTRDHLEFLARTTDLEGLPRVKLASPTQFFADLKQQGLPKERYVGELYFQAHRGTYTSQAKTKLLNRRSEFALREAEYWGSLARATNGYPFTPSILKDSWLKVLVNQFHDILPGSSIHRVYEEAVIDYEKAIEKAQEVAISAAASLVEKAPKLTIFNSLSWQRDFLLELPGKLAIVSLPPCGWTSINPKTIPAVNKKHPAVKVSTSILENEQFIVNLNERGELTSLLDKSSGMDILAGTANRMCLYKDIPSRFDAWDIDSMTENLPISIDEAVHLEVLQSDAILGKLQLKRKVHDSTLTQQIIIRSGSRRIDFKTSVDWQESHKLLKVAFPVNVHANEALHEIQFGHIKRPNHRSRPFDADRFEVSNHKWTAMVEPNRGVAILNDCKYGINVLDNSLNLTLLKSALAPDSTADKGLQTFTYSFYYWNGSFMESRVVQEAYELNCPPLIIQGNGGENTLFSLDARNIILETIKPAEDGSADIILRLYESMGTRTRCKLSSSLAIEKVILTDMLERHQAEIKASGKRFGLEFRPFEIKTLRIVLKSD